MQPSTFCNSCSTATRNIALERQSASIGERLSSVAASGTAKVKNELAVRVLFANDKDYFSKILIVLIDRSVPEDISAADGAQQGFASFRHCKFSGGGLEKAGRNAERIDDQFCLSQGCRYLLFAVAKMEPMVVRSAKGCRSRASALAGSMANDRSYHSFDSDQRP